MGRALLWGSSIALYAAFVLWYTDFGGPLREDEIDAFVATLEERGFDDERLARVRRFMEQDTGRQFLMVNLLDMAENPPDVAGGPRGMTASQMMDHYMEHMYGQMFSRACHPAFFGSAVNRAMDLVGIEGAEEWTTGALVRYRSRRTFMEIVSHPDMNARHAYKVAALEKTIAFPVEVVLHPGDPRLLLGLVLLAGTALLQLAAFRRR